MNKKQLLLLLAFASATQTNTFVGPARMAAQRLVMAAKAKGLKTASKVTALPENQKRAFGAVAGGTTGYCAAGDSWEQKAAGTLGGAALGFTLAGQSSRLKDVQTRVKDIQGRVKGLDETAARKTDLKATEAFLKGHVSETAQGLKSYFTKNGRLAFKRVENKVDGVEKCLSTQMKTGFEENKALHNQVHDKVKGLWSKWADKK